MKIEALINKYFEGETTCEEEKELRRFFQQANVPEELEPYKPLFSFFDEESEKYSVQPKPISKFRRFAPKSWIRISACAAVLISLGIGINQHIQSSKSLDESENCTYIDGKKYTDPTVIRKQALASLSDVQSSQEEVMSLLFNENE